MIVNSIQDVYNLVKDLDLKKNDTLILGLDQWNFNKKYFARYTNTYTSNNLNLPFILFDNSKQLDSLLLIGSKAIQNFSGFRNDGSYFYGRRFIVPKKRLKTSILKTLMTGLKKEIKDLSMVQKLIINN